MPSPSLEQCRKQAKDLVEAWNAGDRTAFARVREHQLDLRASPPAGPESARFTLADAQAVIAREHGFEDWDRFVAHTEVLKDTHSSLSQFETAVDAIVDGDIRTLARLLRTNPGLVRARSTRTHHAMLLHYVGANGVENVRQRTPGNALEVARLLLDAGADVNATADMYGGADTLGLVATSIPPLTAGVQEPLMELLLSRGASLATAAGGEKSSSVINACLANGRPGAAEYLAKRAGTLDLEAAAGLGQLDLVKAFFTGHGSLTQGATPQQMKDGFSWACEYGRTDVVDFLLQHGMDAGTRLRPHGQTGLHWAAYGGHEPTVRVLLDQHPPVDARDETFGGTPLGWALYAWGGGREEVASDSYYDVVELLVASGATVDAEWLDDTKRGVPLVRRISEDARMRAVLPKNP